jgi:hypothetical protein
VPDQLRGFAVTVPQALELVGRYHDGGVQLFIGNIYKGDPGIARDRGHAPFCLKGVTHCGEVEPSAALETARVPLTRATVGIAAVVPASKLHEIPFSPEVKALRGQFVKCSREFCWV